MKHVARFMIFVALAIGISSAAFTAEGMEDEIVFAPDTRLTSMELMARAAAGDPSAQYVLGRRYLFSQHGEDDAQDAWFWIHNSANMNFPPAQFLMAYICAKGIGMAKNMESSRAWLQLAADNGNEMAQRVLRGASFQDVMKGHFPETAH